MCSKEDEKVALLTEVTNKNALRNLLAEELKENDELLKGGDGDSSSGSDDAPSEDNLSMDEIAKIVPVIDKSGKDQLKKSKKKKEQQSKEEKKLQSKKTLRKQGSSNSLP